MDGGIEGWRRGECPPRSPSPRSAPQIIEKRRRDRINNSLSELRRLVPSAFEKQVGGSQPRTGFALPELLQEGLGHPRPCLESFPLPLPS